jgi:hypothetical protein
MVRALDDFQRQRRARNLALAGVLVGFVALIFVITVVRLSLLQ